MGGCSSSSSDPDRRRRDLDLLLAWKHLIDSMSEQDRHVTRAKGKMSCSGVAFSVWRAKSSIDVRHDAIRFCRPEADDWMILINACGTPLYLSCLEFGPEAEARCKSKDLVCLSQENTRRNFDDKGLLKQLPKSTRLALESLKLYHADLHPTIGNTAHSHLHDDHWSKVSRLCMSCRDTWEAEQEELQDALSSGAISPDAVSPESGIILHRHLTSPNSVPLSVNNPGHSIFAAGHAHSVPSNYRSLAVPGHSPRPHSNPGSRAGSRPASRAASRAGSRAGTPERSQNHSRAGSRNNSPSRSQREHSVKRLPNAQSQPGLQSLRPGAATGYAHELPIFPDPLAAAPHLHGPQHHLHSHHSSFPSAGIHAAQIRLDVPGGSVSQRGSRPHSRAGFTEWHSGTYFVTTSGCAEMEPTKVIARVETEGSNAFLYVDNQTRHPIHFSAPNVGPAFDLAAGRPSRVHAAHV
jgi:hypothetical protein